MSATRVSAPAAPYSVQAQDVAALAWVLEAIRQSLASANKAIRRFVRETAAVRDADMATLGSDALHIAQQHLHRSCGVLHMVDMPQAALLLHAMEAAVQHYAQKPADCTDVAVRALEVASSAVLEFLQAVLAGKPIDAVALFPQYRDVQALYEASNQVSPADLWSLEPRWCDPDLAAWAAPLTDGVPQRTIMDEAVLQLVRGEKIAQSSGYMREICIGYAHAQTEASQRFFWKIASAYFDAIAHGLLTMDIFAKRIASRVLMAVVALTKGQDAVSERLQQDMLFFCAQARGKAEGVSGAIIWKTVYDALDLQRYTPVDYERVRFGRFDPQALAQAQKRIDAAANLWAELAGGDAQQIKPCVEQFSLLGESLQQLLPGGKALAQALQQVLSSVARRGQPPSAEIAMEVATTVLYLQASFAALDSSDEDMSRHFATLTRRLLAVQSNEAAQPLEPWMAQLYRQMSEQQTMGNVVGELRGILAETEKWLDQYFRCPQDTSMLNAVASHLSKMRGVLSVLGFEPAAQAMVRMRQYVERLQTADQPENEQRILCEKIGNSLGTLVFLVDMLGYQRHLARQLYVFDTQEGELKLRMGRVPTGDESGSQAAQRLLQTKREEGVDALLTVVEFSEAEVPTAVDRPATEALMVEDECSDSDLLNTFLQEAREAMSNGRAALQTLAGDLADKRAQTELRRVFHTLKGSSRMVQLDAFGQASWAMEQMLNAWLVERKAMPNAMCQLVGQALDGLDAWVAAMDAHCADAWQFAPFRDSADAMRLQGRFLPLDMQAVKAKPEDGLSAQAVMVTGASDVPPLSDVKKIGDLAVSLRLYNVYLGEAEGWSAQLLEVLRNWQFALEEAPPAMAEVWAHSLAGSSATVGFMALSGLARTLEHALQHVRRHPHGAAAQVQTFVLAAEEIRAMLHQFAAGFLPHASQRVQAQLQQILEGACAIHPDQSERFDEAQTARAITAAESEAQSLVEPTVPQVASAQEPECMPEADDALSLELLPHFEEEARQLLLTMGAALRAWYACPADADADARHTLLRSLHTFKGSARLVGALRLGDMAHCLESKVQEIEVASNALIEPLFAHLDAMDAVLQGIGAQDTLKAPVKAAVPAGAVGGELAMPTHVQQEPLVAQQVMPLPSVVGFSAVPSVQQGRDVVQTASQPTVRVRSQLLGQLTNEVGEVLIARARLDARVHGIKHSLQDLSSNLDKLRKQLRDVEVQTESQMQSRMQFATAAGKDFDPLELDRYTHVQELTRMMAESVNDVATVHRNLQRDADAVEDDLIAQGHQARALQRDLLRTCMVGLDSIAERLHAVVRRTAKETGKQVKLRLVGSRIEMERGVLERIAPAFEHLLRNCVDHGIEMPELRAAAGKPVIGSITVQVQQEGNDVAVSFQDDGAGLNVARIRDQALAQGLIIAQDDVDAARAAQLIFMPGFTTAQQLTGVSGRGIGMDIVRAEVQALGGRIETHSTPGQGVVFRLVLPLTTAVTQVVMLRAGAFLVGIPVSLVEAVRRISVADVETAYHSGELREGSECMPFYWAGAVWAQSPCSEEVRSGKTCPVVLIRSAAQRIALHVDEVLGQQEVVVKPLDAQMSRLPGLTGMSVLASGAVVLIYNPVALTMVHGAQIRTLGQGLPAVLDAQAAQQLRREQAPVKQATSARSSSSVPVVMVVDDSITVRRVSQRLLQREGYRVITANDGRQALDKLQGDALPCVVLSDIEMPGMDGFDLLRSIRATERLQHLPVIMITSRMAQKHHDHAMKLGANHYLGKPYSDETLMALVRHYAVGQPLPASQDGSRAMRSV